ncbi:MAG: response regulator, partial [Myxococcales bacterium]
GLEAPDVRQRAGKPRRGRILIAAESREGLVFLDISDDGRGIDGQRVREVAVARGMLTAEAAASLGEDAILDLLFQPGFSTATEVTATSGRGVGLDVVRENLIKLGGRLDVRTRPGEGTAFQLSLPLTLAASRGLLVGASRQIYCLPASAVDEVLAFEPQQVAPTQSQLAIERRGQALSFYRLDDLLAGRPIARPTRHGFAVVLAVSDKRLALGVDELLGQEEVVVKGLAPGTPRLPLVSGATSLADGRLVTVLDPAALFAASQASRAAVSARPMRKATVLVVDDALTSRTLLASVLERAGLQTVLAPDGEAALHALAAGGIDLVVTDLEMPNLDGLGLVRRIRASPAWSALPVVMVTSLGSPEDRARGAEAGADAYVVKRDFDPAKFVQLVVDRLGLEGAP